MTATTAVLTTVELLEQILLCLPMLDIVRKERVCRLWHQCIKNSTLLQRRLFREPIPAAEAPRVCRYLQYSAQPVTVNPLLQNVFRIRHSEVSQPYITIAPPSGKRRLQSKSLRENVLKKAQQSRTLVGINERPLILEGEECGRDLVPHRFRQPHHRAFHVLGERSQRRAAPESYDCGWWAPFMLATQPALMSLTIRRGDTDPGRASTVIASNGIGITMRDLVGTAAGLCSQPDDEFLCDEELTIYQPLDVVRLDARDARLTYVAQGRRVTVDEYDEVSFQRAWKTSLKCNLA